MNERDIYDILQRHRRRKLLWWLCNCGRRYSACPPRQDAESARIVRNNRPREAAVMSQLRLRATVERLAEHNQRPWPTGPTSTWPPR